MLIIISVSEQHIKRSIAHDLDKKFQNLHKTAYFGSQKECPAGPSKLPIVHCHNPGCVLIITSVSEHIKRSIAHDRDVLTQQIPNNSHVFVIYEFRTHLEQFGL